MDKRKQVVLFSQKTAETIKTSNIQVVKPAGGKPMTTITIPAQQVQAPVDIPPHKCSLCEKAFHNKGRI